MMNKKVVASILTAAMVSTMAAPAMASNLTPVGGGESQVQTDTRAPGEDPAETVQEAAEESSQPQPETTENPETTEDPGTTESPAAQAAEETGDSQRRSPVIGAGITFPVERGPGVGGGPGVAGGAAGTEAAQSGQQADGNTSFAGRLDSPIVQAVEKYSYEDMTTDINDLRNRYSGHMSTRTFGSTLDGRHLYEIIVGNKDAGKHILIHAGIHAREYMTPLLVMKQAEHALAFYSSASYEGVALSDLLNNVAIHFVPMVNPDGIALSQFGIGAIRTEELRQSINQCYASDVALGRTSAAFDRYLLYWKANGRGVDLNQNFPANWEQIRGASAPSYATYKGASPLSEPESQALVELTNSRTWAATISYHSMGNIIYWDYAGNRVSEQSLALANIIGQKTGYRLAGSSGNGGYKDWVQIKDQAIPSLTLETGSVACPLPLSEFSDIWARNQEVWAAVAKYAMEH